MTIRYMDLTERHSSAVISITQELSEHPDLSSAEIAERLGISREELLDCYDIIQNNGELQRTVIENSVSPRLTTSASDLLTQHKDYITKILSGEEVYPLILEFHPGPVCQCQCKFCFSDGWDYAELVNSEKPIHRERVLEVFDDCRQKGVEEIWFSGGKEPFVNPLTPEYIRLANETGFKTRLYTNGIAMNKDIQESILDCHQIRISINGAKPSTYANIQFRSKSGAQLDGIYDRVLDNVSSLVSLKRQRNKGLKIGISQILQPDNHDEMQEFTKMAEGLGVDSVHFRLEAMGMVRDFTPGEYETIRSEIAELTENHYDLEIDIRGVAEGEFESRASQFLPKLRPPSRCRAGLLKRGLNPYGGVYYCEFSSHPRFRVDSAHLRLGDVNHEALGDILLQNTGKYPPTCPLCQAHEYGMNLTLEKIERDLWYGIPIERQPYYRKH
jgi:TDP-4-amino-4,6-dideoxy-D-glucose deaminase